MFIWFRPVFTHEHGRLTALRHGTVRVTKRKPGKEWTAVAEVTSREAGLRLIRRICGEAVPYDVGSPAEFWFSGNAADLAVCLTKADRLAKRNPHRESESVRDRDEAFRDGERYGNKHPKADAAKEQKIAFDGYGIDAYAFLDGIRVARTGTIEEE